MASIPEEDIEGLKRETDLAALIRSRGIELRKHGSKDLVARCPFHEDNDSPNFIVTPSKGLFHCMACGAAGNPIQFVERFDGVSFRHAFELLSEGKTAFENAKSQRTKKATVPKLACPLDAEADDGTLLDQVSDYYHERLSHSKAALEYLASRGLDDEELANRFRIGVADRTLGLRLPEKNRKDGAALRTRLQKLGVYRESGHEHFNGSLVFPIVNGNGHVGEPSRLAGGEIHDPPRSPGGQAWLGGGHVCEIYGRKITRNLRKGTPDHLYLPGPHHGIFNPEALKSPEIILCESILDALTFIRNGMDNATCIYGTQGFTEELFEAIRQANLDAVRLAYDADDSGERAANRDSERLQSIGVSCYRIQLPLGEDANSYALKAGPEALKKAVRSARWLGAGKAPYSTPTIAAESVAEEEQAKEKSPEGSEGLWTEAEPKPKGRAAKAVAASQKAVDLPTVALVPTGEHHELTLGSRRYRVGGLQKNGGLDSLKITLRVWSEERFHLDQLDLCKDMDRRRFSERAAQECRLESDLIHRDLGKLLLACEQAQDERLRADLDTGEAMVVSIPEEERQEAEALLQSPDLIERLNESFDAAGVVGEQTNKLAAYLAATSRLLDKPLAVIIQSTSAAGKTTLMEAVLSFFPGEDQMKYSAMTGQSLYYLGEKNLQHKILAIVEEEGAEKASYALKLLQSEGELTIASTGKDATTGRMKTEEYHVEGPVAIVLTTTSIDIDEELMNRCLVLTVDESKEQTERIHQMQRQARTLEGLKLKKRRARILTLLQNVQRLLQPVDIINPYADRLTFTATRTRTRRDHEKYLTLIEAVTLLHQHQRPRETDPEAGTFIRTTVADIAVANRLAPEMLGRSLDEVPPQTRRLLEELKALVMERSEAEAIDQDKVLFTRREVRERTGTSETQIRLHLQRLEDLEYIARRHGRNGISCLYELMIDAREPNGIYHVDLLDLDTLPV